MLARWSWLCLAVLTVIGCRDRSDLEQRAAAPAAQRLVGTWDVRFDLDQAPMLTARRHAAGSVRGRLAFLANRWVGVSYPRIEMPTDYGTYDIDFTPFGFDPRNEGETPTAVAGWLPGDSVEIMLGPDQSRAAVTMRGKFARDSIAGTWDVSITRGAGGGGRFLVWRHHDR